MLNAVDHTVYNAISYWLGTYTEWSLNAISIYFSITIIVVYIMSLPMYI